jgi:glycosyltransferase involved in cell wall biosynthesis
MKVSVLIPAYNCAATIAATLDSVLCQTAPADEVLVMNDGSTDGTAAILSRYEPRIKAFWQPNGGLSSTRNALIARAQGDLIAFLDADDVWHPTYLEMQCKVFEDRPQTAAVFAAHTNFCRLGSYDWGSAPPDGQLKVEIFDPLSFFQRFQRAPGHFIMSFCCVPKRVLESMGSEPFKLRAPAEDVYFCNLLLFRGTVAFYSSPFLGAYRISEGSLSSNRLSCAEAEVKAFQLLEKYYREASAVRLVREFERAFASKRRAYAKILMGVGRVSEARGQLWSSLSQSLDPVSVSKSLTLLFLSYVPRSLQPKWPPVGRQWNSPESLPASGRDATHLTV